jgi:hypothetical protein
LFEPRIVPALINVNRVSRGYQIGGHDRQTYNEQKQHYQPLIDTPCSDNLSHRDAAVKRKIAPIAREAQEKKFALYKQARVPFGPLCLSGSRR